MFKNKIYNYITLELIKSFVLILFSLSLIAWTVRAVNFLDLIVDSGYSTSTYFIYSILNLTNIMTKFIPLSFLLALLLTIIRLERQNELLVLWTSGVAKSKITNLFFLLSLFIFLIYIIFSTIITPTALYKSRTLVKQSGVDTVANLIKPNTFSDTFKGLTFYVEEKENNVIKNIFIKDDSNNLNSLLPKNSSAKNKTVIAERGVISKSKLILENGFIQSFQNDNTVKIIQFNKTLLNFDNLDNWLIETGNGSWGWGNGELQYYSENNVEISEIPNEPGNNGLHIVGKEESGSNIVDQWGNSLNYTSGKITSKSKISLQYGMIETRALVPDINLGGWPAIWMLGTANYNWPRCGELDMMEMGHTQAFRDLHDEHNGGNGNNNSTVNQMVGANAIFYADEAVNEGNPSGAASISWDPDDDYCRPYYNYDNLNNRFLTYRIYWDPDSIRFTIIDDGSEYDFYTDIFPIDSVSDEFNAPFFFNINLAIGGTLTDAYNLGDPGSGLPISLPLPTSMYVDYIQIREWNGHGNVHIGPPEFEGGTYGLFTDTTPVDNGLIPGENAEIYVWEGTLSEGSIPPFEGENGITWTSTGSGWFGAGIMSIQPVNLFNFGDGYLKFRIKIPSNVSFQIGIIDAWGNQSYVEFPSGQTRYGLVRDGEWGQASIPIEDIRGDYIDLRMLSYEFVILEVNGASCEFALDDIYWEGGGTVDVTNENKDLISQKFVLYDNYPNPFNPSTNISYLISNGEYVSINIFDVNGGKVREIFNDYRSAGTYSIDWNGQNERGLQVSAGVYLYIIEAGKFRQTKKMILLK